MKYYLSLFILPALLLVGYSSHDKSLYYWGDYQDNVYKTLKQTKANPTEQIAALEKIITVADSKNKAVPPGLYAHLGLLYIQEGRYAEAKASLDKEKSLYPESTNYMTFLTNNMEGKRNQ
ncbi:DUF4810 domain-containing protein [Orbaceae bacterium ESL0727]|nr:DUF4810 domain-containing protein [Orbaceae bacterium ESL0727]